MLGMICFHFYKAQAFGRLFERSPARALPLLLLVMPGIQYAIGETPLHDALPRTLLYGLPAAALVLLVLNNETFFKESMLADVWTRLGHWSYSTYLIHIYVVVLLTRVFPFEVESFPGFLVYLAAVLAVVLPVSAFSYRFIELASKRFLTGLLVGGHRPSRSSADAPALPPVDS